jgi:hypothetical protein
VSWRRSRRSPARCHGWRRARPPWLVGAYATGCTAWCLGRPRTRRAFLWRPCGRLTGPRRARRRHEKGAQGPALPSSLRRTRAGLHACERRGPHGRVRADTHATRTRRGRTDTTQRRRTVAASYGKRDEARRVARAPTKAAAPAEDGNPAWLDGRHHQQRRGGAVARNILPRLEGRGVHRGGETAPSPGWPLAEV